MKDYMQYIFSKFRSFEFPIIVGACCAVYHYTMPQFGYLLTFLSALLTFTIAYTLFYFLQNSLVTGFNARSQMLLYISLFIISIFMLFS